MQTFVTRPPVLMQTIVDTVEKVVGSYLQRQGLASSVAVAV